MTSRPSFLASPRVAPLATSSLTTVSLNKTFQNLSASNPSISELPMRPNDHQLYHYSNQLRLRLQWLPAARIQLLVFRNSIACVFAAVFVNGCFYSGNIFSFKHSIEQSPSEFLMATLIWTIISYAFIMLAFHLPPLTTQRFFEFPDDKPSLWFCAKRLIKRSAPYFTISLVGLVCVGLLVQHTALMKDLIVYKMHFYLGDLCNLVFSAGIALAVRKIYYEETYQGRDRRIAFPNISKPRASKKSLPRISPSAAYAASHYSAPSFWSEICGKLPHTILIALAGGYVHLVSWYRILNQGTAVIMAFTMLGIGIKLALQEVSKWFILKKGIRSIRTMCVLVGVPTVLIDTQARIVLIGTQSNSFLIRGTFGMAVAEITLRAVKAAFVAWNIRRRATILGESCQDASSEYATSKEHRQPPPNLEFQLWRRQILAYHTAEITADTYAEYIAIGCSQSITFWFVGHPLYPALQLDTGIGGGPLSELNTARWRINQVGMLAFQFIVEIFVDYICVVMEMAAGIDFDRIQDLSSFLGVLFMTMAVINICISSAVYLCTP